MSHQKNRRRTTRPHRDPETERAEDRLRDEPDPEDGIDPRVLFRNHYRAENPRRADDHKLRQLCTQAQRALSFALQELADPLLRDLAVVAVRPAPDAGRLRVSVRPFDGACLDSDERALVESRLVVAQGLLRTAVAQAVRRRRAPDLSFALADGPDDVDAGRCGGGAR